MKAITIWQPWASLMAIEAKRVETRSWETKYRGLLAIHAAKWKRSTHPDRCDDVTFRSIADPFRSALKAGGLHAGNLPSGAIVAVGELQIIRESHDIRGLLSAQELAFGDYSDGRFGRVFSDVVRLREPVLCRGFQQLWTVPPSTEQLVLEQIRRYVVNAREERS
jgi:hypothetical protein